MGISRALAGVIFKQEETLCSLAYRYRHKHFIARMWVKAFGEGHCYREWNKYWVTYVNQEHG